LGQLTVNSYALAGWTDGGTEGFYGSQTTPPVFIFYPASSVLLSSTGVAGDAFMGTVKFYGVTSPGLDGAGVVAAEGDPSRAGSISQTVAGLMAGDTYSLTFNWAGARWIGFSGDTTEKWQVTFGSSTQSTSTEITPSETFAGWQKGSMNFTAPLTSEALTFLAIGEPPGEQPWLLLDSVSLTDTTPSSVAPEPGSVVLMGNGGRRSDWRCAPNGVKRLAAPRTELLKQAPGAPHCSFGKAFGVPPNKTIRVCATQFVLTST